LSDGGSITIATATPIIWAIIAGGIKRSLAFYISSIFSTGKSFLRAFIVHLLIRPQ